MKTLETTTAPATSPATLVRHTRLALAKTRELLNNQSRLALAKTRELLNDQTDGLPVWIRAPKIGVEFYSGFSRSKLYQGAAKGHFRSVSIREPGQTKGTRLFHLQSILDFIARCEQNAAATA